MNAPHVLNVIVPQQFIGRRVDDVLRAVLGMSARQIRAVKYARGFYLDGQCVYCNAKVQPGQRISVVCENAYDQGIVPQRAPLDIAYEDEHLLIINKTAPLATLPTPSLPLDTLANHVAAYMRQQRFIFRPVNRLDRGTSGLLVAAKHTLAQKKLMDVLHTDAFVREYTALVEGVIAQDGGRIDKPIGRKEQGSVHRMVTEEGKRSVTQFTTMQRFTQTNQTLIKLRLHTGRTHQIRVHMAYIGHPVVGDYLYGTPCDDLGERFALHASHLHLLHPISGAVLDLVSELPQNIQRLCNKG